MKTGDTADPARLRRLAWGAAISAWQAGDHAPLVRLLRGRGAVPTFAREFLADLAAGKAQRTRGRPAERSAEHQRTLWHLVMAEQDRIDSREAAIFAVARARQIGDGALRRIMDDLRREGLTRALWANRLRPK